MLFPWKQESSYPECLIVLAGLDTETEKQKIGFKWGASKSRNWGHSGNTWNSALGASSLVCVWGRYLGVGSSTDSPRCLQNTRNSARMKRPLAKKSPKAVVCSVGEKEHPLGSKRCCGCLCIFTGALGPRTPRACAFSRLSDLCWFSASFHIRTLF